MEIRGYKVFNPDWTCYNGFQYRVGVTYTMNEDPVLCKRGFHFCRDAIDCFKYYTYNSDNKVAAVVALGDVDESKTDTKICTNKIRIEKELSWHTISKLANIGSGNIGTHNIGDYNNGTNNTGDHNYGYANTGDRNYGELNCGCQNSGDNNCGNHNIGDWNTGSYNQGDRNAGIANHGSRNTGHHNVGDRNTGDWNLTNDSTGCFNTEKSTIKMFNKDSDWTYLDWRASRASQILSSIVQPDIYWIDRDDLTVEEALLAPESLGTTGGSLKKERKVKLSQALWDYLPEPQKDIVKAIPNFDPDIFYKCTGIDTSR